MGSFHTINKYYKSTDRPTDRPTDPIIPCRASAFLQPVRPRHPAPYSFFHRPSLSYLAGRIPRRDGVKHNHPSPYLFLFIIIIIHRSTQLKPSASNSPSPRLPINRAVGSFHTIKKKPKSLSFSEKDYKKKKVPVLGVVTVTYTTNSYFPARLA